MITIFIVWYERKSDFSPDYDKQHHGTIQRETPAECMLKFHTLRQNHDMTKYTRLEIVDMW